MPLQPVIGPVTGSLFRNLTSAVLDVDGTAAESTAESSSIDILVDASVLFDSLKLGSMNGFLPSCRLMPPDGNT